MRILVEFNEKLNVQGIQCLFGKLMNEYSLDEDTEVVLSYENFSDLKKEVINWRMTEYTNPQGNDKVFLYTICGRSFVKPANIANSEAFVISKNHTFQITNKLIEFKNDMKDLLDA